tara:strand:+ start:665 stop:802 length:138 start_codon:yes stop_codon:yes gene_type:complete
MVEDRFWHQSKFAKRLYKYGMGIYGDFKSLKEIELFLSLSVAKKP